MTNICESIPQACLLQSRARVWGSKKHRSQKVQSINKLMLVVSQDTATCPGCWNSPKAFGTTRARRRDLGHMVIIRRLWGNQQANFPRSMGKSLQRSLRHGGDSSRRIALKVRSTPLREEAVRPLKRCRRTVSTGNKIPVDDTVVHIGKDD